MKTQLQSVKSSDNSCFIVTYTFSRASSFVFGMSFDRLSYIYLFRKCCEMFHIQLKINGGKDMQNVLFFKFQ